MESIESRGDGHQRRERYVRPKRPETVMDMINLWTKYYNTMLFRDLVLKNGMDGDAAGDLLRGAEAEARKFFTEEIMADRALRESLHRTKLPFPPTAR